MLSYGSRRLRLVRAVALPLVAPRAVFNYLVLMKPPAKIIALSLVSLVALALLLRDRLPPTSAADAESITGGATDPTWSPDGSRLAFSLFGDRKSVV